MTAGDEVVPRSAVGDEYRSRAGVPNAVVLRVWRGPQAGFVLALAAVWIAFGSFATLVPLESSTLPGSGAALLLAWTWRLVHGAAAVALVYYGAALLFDRTVLAVDEHAIELRHRPLPWWGARRIPWSRIRVVRTVSLTDADGATELALVVETDAGLVILVEGVHDERVRRDVEGLVEHHFELVGATRSDAEPPPSVAA